jgi:hypothetical protein
MMFLNPLALFALAAAAIPIAVHLFNFRRPRKIDFSSLVFLREVERSAMQRLRIRQWLLLALRTLAIACLVLAFSRPTLTGGLGAFIGASGPRSTAIVLDNSLSMTMAERQGARLRIAKDAALLLAEEADSDDELYLVTTSGEPEPSPGPLRRGTIGEAVARVTAGPQARTLDRAIAHAGTLLAESSHPNREIIVVSDLQSSMLVDTLDIMQVSADHVALVDVGSRIPANISVDEVEVVSRVIDEGREARVDATILNHGPDDRPDVVVSLYLEDERVAQTVLDLPGAGSADLSFSVTPRSRGWLRGRVVVDDASFEADNERYFVLFVPERRRLLVVRGGGASARYLELALSPELADDRLVFERDVIGQSALAGQALGAYDAVLLVGVDGLSAGDVATLAQYVDEGGGVLLTPGSRVSIDDVNTLLSRIGGGRVEALSGAIGGESIGRVDRIEAEHALFEGVFDGRESIRAEQPEVFASLRYIPGGLGEQTLMRLSNGWPFLQELRHGSGVVLLMTSAPDPAWSELAVRGLFVPLAYRISFYLAATEAASASLVAGREATVMLRDARAGESVRAILPDGTEMAPEQRSVLGTTRVTLGERATDERGWIDIRDQASGRLFQRLAINHDPQESEPELLAAHEAATMLSDRLGMEVTPLVRGEVRGDVFAGLRASRRGVEIWNVFLLLALGFLVAEALVARRWKADSGNV